MNTSFEKSKNSTDEWCTPKEIIDALGEFDLDPCAPMRPLWRTARVMYNKEQDGTIGESPGCGSILVAFGEENAEALRSSNIEGRYIQVNQEPCNTHVDWEQRRYEIAKTILPITSVSGRGPHGELILEACDKAAELAVIYADALIKELK